MSTIYFNSKSIILFYIIIKNLAIKESINKNIFIKIFSNIIHVYRFLFNFNKNELINYYLFINIIK